MLYHPIETNILDYNCSLKEQIRFSKIVKYYEEVASVLKRKIEIYCNRTSHSYRLKN